MTKLFNSTSLRTIALCQLVALIAGALFGTVVAGKQLVVFAGPHKTSETDVEEFFYKYARGDTPELENEKSLLGWSWPQILGLGSPHKAYDRLVIDYDNPNVRETVMNNLATHLNKSSQGFIIGGNEYDRIGNTYWSHRDALAVISEIAATTRVEKNDVTIILLYQYPRAEQWLSLFTYEMAESTGIGFKNDYEEFLCDPDTFNNRLEILETAMNPFLVSTLYINAGYSVVMIDLEGVQDAGLAVEHVIGCEILDGTKCTDGRLDNLEAESFSTYHEKNDVAIHPFHSLNVEDVRSLEKLFELRDCNYIRIAEHPNFKILYQKHAITSCPERGIDSINMLSDTYTLFNAIQSQKECNADDVALEKILEKAPEVDVVDISKYSGKKKTIVSTTNTTNTTSTEESTDMKESGDEALVASIKKNENGDEDFISPTIQGEGGISRSVQYASVLVVFLAIGIVIWIGFVVHSQWKHKRQDRYTQIEFDGIMPAIREDKNRPLSEIM